MDFKNLAVLDHLYGIKYIGPFPQGIEVLLVPVDTALAETIKIEPTLTRNTLRTYLTQHKIFIFNSLEDWVKFKTPKKDKK